MKRIILIIFTIMLGLFLVSCDNPKHSMPKLNEKNKVKLTENEYLETINSLVDIDTPIEIGLYHLFKNQRMIAGLDNGVSEVVRENTSRVKLDKDNNSVEKAVESIENKFISEKTKTFTSMNNKRTNYFDSKSDKLYYDINNKTKSSEKELNQKEKGKYFSFKTDQTKPRYNYNFKFINDIIKSNDFIKIILSDYKHLNIYQTREMFTINFKYIKQFAKDPEELVKNFINNYQNEMVPQININNDFEFTLIYKENKFLSFNIESFEYETMWSDNLEITSKLYVKSDSKPPKFPNFDKYDIPYRY